MKYKHVRVAVRCALRIGESAWVHVDPHSKDNKPAVWWFGGVITGKDEHRKDLEREFGAERFEGDLGRPDDDPNDLSCWILLSALGDFQRWVTKNVSAAMIAKAAAREIREEFRDFGLPKHLAAAVRHGNYESFDLKGLIHTYTGKPSSNAMCCTYVMQCPVSAAAAKEIKRRVDDHEDLYLITSADVEKGFIQGTVNGRPTQILVPAALGLLFK